MTDPYLYTVSNNVATFSINDAPWNLMSLDYIDRLEEQLPEVLADDQIRAMIFEPINVVKTHQIPRRIVNAKSRYVVAYCI